MLPTIELFFYDNNNTEFKAAVEIAKKDANEAKLTTGGSTEAGQGTAPAAGNVAAHQKANELESKIQRWANDLSGKTANLTNGSGLMISTTDNGQWVIGKSSDGTPYIQNEECYHLNFDGHPINFSIKDGTVYFATNSGFKDWRTCPTNIVDHHIQKLTPFLDGTINVTNQTVASRRSDPSPNPQIAPERGRRPSTVTDKPSVITSHNTTSIDDVFKSAITNSTSASNAVKKLETQSITADMIHEEVKCLAVHREKILNILKSKTSEITELHEKMEKHFDDTNGMVSQVGLNSFMQSSLENPNFIQLLSDNMQLLLELSVLNDDDFKGLGISDLFGSIQNIYTNSTFNFQYNGISANNRQIYNSFLANLFSLASPIAIFVPPNNAYDVNTESDQQKFIDGITRQRQLSDTFNTCITTIYKKISKTRPKQSPTDEDEAMFEPFDPNKWEDYTARFNALKQSLTNCFDNPFVDNCANYLAQYNLDNISKNMFSQSMVHFGLDSKHLGHILCGTYDGDTHAVQNYRKALFDLLNHLKTPNHNVDESAQIQLFYRLKLLENRFKEECKIKNITDYTLYMNRYIHKKVNFYTVSEVIDGTRQTKTVYSNQTEQTTPSPNVYHPISQLDNDTLNLIQPIATELDVSEQLTQCLMLAKNKPLDLPTLKKIYHLIQIHFIILMH